MPDKTTLGVSDTFREYIEALVEEVVINGDPFETQKKWLRRYAENESVDYEKLEKSITALFEALEELKSHESKSVERLVKMLGEDCYLSVEAVDKLVATVKGARNVREEAERKAKEEAERKAREEAARKAKEEAERKAREETARKAKEEAVRKAELHANCFIWAESFSEGLARVKIGDKCGFIDKTGKMIIEPKFTNIASFMFGHESKDGFAEGIAVVSVGETISKYGLINSLGDFVIQPQFDLISRFSEGLAAVKIDGKWGFINMKGEIVVQPIYEDVCGFSEGLACVKIKNDKYAFIDRWGHIVFEKSKNIVFSLDEGFPFRMAEFSWAWNFHDGWARVDCLGKKGYINKRGIFTKINYDSFDDFSEGLASFSVEKYTICGYIDKELRVVIAPKFNSAREFHDGKAAVRLANKIGFIDKTGIIVIPCQFDSAGCFSDGMAAIQLNHRFGYVNESGDMIIPPRFSSARAFSEGVAAVEENGKWGFIDKSGNYIF